MADTLKADVASVGAGIAGAGLTAELAGDFSVVMIEREARPDYHSTGRSAAVFIQNYGNAAIRALTRASRPLFEQADRALFPNPLLSRRGTLTIADADSLAALRSILKESPELQEISPDEACAMVPIVRREGLLAAAYEHDAQDIDVAALHQGWLKKARAGGAKLLTNAEVVRAERISGHWRVETRESSSTPPAPGPILWRKSAAWHLSVSSRSGVRSPCCRCRSVMTCRTGRLSMMLPSVGT